MLKANEIRNQNDDELALKLLELRKEIFELRGLQGDSSSQKTHLIGQKRKEVARILTCQNERKRASQEEIK